MSHSGKPIGLKTGFWSLFDQGAVSLGNFLTQILLARNLNASDYGVFALLYGLLFLLISSLGTVVTYPLSVQGARSDSRDLRRLAGVSLWLDAALVLPQALVVLGGVALLHRLDLFPWVLVALVSWQFQETLRRALMARLGHHDAAWGDALSYLGQAVTIVALTATRSLSLKGAFAAVAATSALAAVVQAIQVRPRSVSIGEAKTVAAGFWKLGGWTLPTNVANGVTLHAFPWTLGLVFGAAEAGSLGAVMNPLKVLNPLLVAAPNWIVPTTSRAQHERGIQAASRSGLTYTVAGAGLLVPYFAVLLLWPHAVLSMAYGASSPYTHLELALRICAVAYSLGYWGDAFTSLLNGLGLPKESFVSQLGATATAVCIGLPLTIMGGLIGALVGVTVCALVKAAASLYFVWDRARGERAEMLPGRATL